MNLIVFLHRTFPRFIFWISRFTGANYEEEMNLLDLLCQPHTLSIDVGAKVGMYTYRMARYSAEVWAFEPIPELAHLLRTQFGRGVHVENVALSDSAGKGTLRIPFTQKHMPKYGLATIDKDNMLNSSRLPTIREVEVDIKCLDDFHIANIGFMKIDVEGHELAVVKGAEDSLRRCHPILLVEANDKYHPGAVQALMAFLEGLDYEGLFVHHGLLNPIRSVETPFHDMGIENFVFVPNANMDLKQKIRSRLSSVRASQ